MTDDEKEAVKKALLELVEECRNGGRRVGELASDRLEAVAKGAEILMQMEEAGRASKPTRNFTDVEHYAAKEFGFDPQLVVPLEVYSGNPARYCMFEVRGIQYQVHGGELSIYEEGR